MHKTHWGLVIFALLLLTINAAAVTVTVLKQDPLPAKAGTYVDVFLNIQNNKNGSSNPVEVELVPRDSIQLAAGQNATKKIGSLPPLGSSVVQYRLQISSNAVDGSNEFDVFTKEGIESPLKTTLTLEVDNETPSLAIGTIQSSPAKLLPDTDDVQLTITILNTGDEVADNVRARLVLPSPLENSNSFSDLQLIGNIAPNSGEDALYFIDIPEDTPAGIYEGNLEVSYTLKNGSTNQPIERTIPFDLVIKPVPRFEITGVVTTPAELTAGDRGVSVLLTMKNVGEADADSVRLTVFQKSEQPFEFDKTFDFVAPTLKTGEEGQATLLFRVKDDAPVQNYLVELEIKSFVDNTVRTQKEVISLPVTKAASSGPDPIWLLGGTILVVLIILGLYYRRQTKLKEQHAHGRK